MISKNKLIYASDHIEYEIWMLRLCAHLIVGFPSGSSPQRIPIKPVTHTHYVEEPVFSSNAPQKPPSPDEHRIVQGNALIESFAVHLRALLDFFYLESSKNDDDILAVHFFNDPNVWEAAKPKLTPAELRAIKTRVKKEVAHLTYKRIAISSVEKDWPIIEYKTHVLDACEKFIECVDSSLLSERWG